jgi:hypothetical protein
MVLDNANGGVIGVEVKATETGRVGEVPRAPSSKMAWRSLRAGLVLYAGERQLSFGVRLQ